MLIRAFPSWREMEDEVRSEFGQLGSQNISEPVLTRLCEMAIERNWNAEKLAEEWTAYATNGDIQLSFEALDRWQRELPVCAREKLK
jgi:hypothetical protein